MKYGKFYHIIMTILVTFSLFLFSVVLLAVNPYLSVISFVITIIFPFYRYLKRIRYEDKMNNLMEAGKIASVEAENLKHVTGLPVPVGLTCKMETYINKIIYHVDGSKKKYIVHLDSVTDVFFYDEKEIIQYQESSLGAALLGGSIAGPIGAIIGAMPSTKERIVNTYYLAVLYNNKTEGQVIMASDSYSLKKTFHFIQDHVKTEETDSIL